MCSINRENIVKRISITMNYFCIWDCTSNYSSILIIELLSRPWTTKAPRYQIGMEEKFDSRVEIVTYLHVICGCQGKQKSTLNYPHTIIENVCSQQNKQDDLLRILMFNQPDNICLYKCDNQEFVNKFQSLMSSTKCKIITK